METVKYLEESMGESFDSGTRKAFFGLKKKKKRRNDNEGKFDRFDYAK